MSSTTPATTCATRRAPHGGSTSASPAVQVAVVLASIPFVTDFYDRSSLGPVLAALALAYFVAQMAVVPEALLRRALRHDLVVKRDVIIDTAAAAASIVLALAGFGVWSLVWPVVASGPLRFIVALVAARGRPGGVRSSGSGGRSCATPST